MRGTRLSDRTMVPTASPSHAGRSADACRACRGSSSCGVVSTVSCPGCEPCAGWPISTHESPVLTSVARNGRRRRRDPPTAPVPATNRQKKATMLATPSFSRAAALVACTLTVSLGAPVLHAEPSASLPQLLVPALERPSPELKAGMSPLAPFLRDATLTLHLRTFYYDGTQNKGTENEAWAGGGWLGYRSGWILDTFVIGATVYGSAPFYAPADKDGTFLLKPGQKGYGVLGEAYSTLRYQDYALLTGYRQLVDQGYINPSDIRMTP